MDNAAGTLSASSSTNPLRSWCDQPRTADPPLTGFASPPRFPCSTFLKLFSILPSDQLVENCSPFPLPSPFCILLLSDRSFPELLGSGNSVTQLLSRALPCQTSQAVVTMITLIIVHKSNKKMMKSPGKFPISECATTQNKFMYYLCVVAKRISNLKL